MSFKLRIHTIAVTCALGFSCSLPLYAIKTRMISLPKNSQDIVLKNNEVSVTVNQRSGALNVVWRDGSKLIGVASGAQLQDGRSLSTTSYATHELELAPASEGAANGQHKYTIRSSSPGMPALLQHIWLFDGKPSLAIEAELAPEVSNVGTRHFAAVQLKGSEAIQVSNSSALRVLHVPFDNDMWFRYDSMAVSGMKDGNLYSSAEATAIYDNDSRQGIILGSITHDTWKTAIDVSATAGRLTSLDIYGGITSPTGVRTETHDIVPHGIVHGEHVKSPRIFIGSFHDWRDGLEAYGKANAEQQPPLGWSQGAPMGWNSWAAYGDKISYQRYLSAAAYVRDTLVPQGFGRNGVVYINLDAFWSRLDAVQLADAVSEIKAMGGSDGLHFKPGIYWTPFAYWSDDLDEFVEGTGMKYRYRDILLKAPDGTFLPKVDGGRPIDPSHPGTRARTAFYIRKFKELGFAYLKLDFLSHGALEGVHYDPSVQTGIQAYNLGMKQIVDENQNQMFLSLSIAPLFPSGYGHARRLSCDTKGHIGGGDQSTEYMLNSLTYGWWTDKNLYITDPDHVVLGDKADLGARNTTEGESRLLSAIISGGMILDSSRLADDPQGRELAKEVYKNRNLFAVASEGKVFRPIEGNTGNQATAVFTRPSSHGYYLALFNYDDKLPKTISVPVSRIAPALTQAQTLNATDVASGAQFPPFQGEVTVQLAPAESRLIEIITTTK